jgi:hypothetical protein
LTYINNVFESIVSSGGKMIAMTSAFIQFIPPIMLRIRDSVSGAFVTTGSGVWDGKKSRQYPGSGMNIPDLIFENLVSDFLVKNRYLT